MACTIDSAILHDRVGSVRAAVEANSKRVDANRHCLLDAIEESAELRADWEPTHKVILHRLLARLEAQPVVEQAKGIVMAQQGCTPEEAFVELRDTARRAHVSVAELAANLVQRTTQGERRRTAVHRGNPAAP